MDVYHKNKMEEIQKTLITRCEMLVRNGNDSSKTVEQILKIEMLLNPQNYIIKIGE